MQDMQDMHGPHTALPQLWLSFPAGMIKYKQYVLRDRGGSLNSGMPTCSASASSHATSLQVAARAASRMSSQDSRSHSGASQSREHSRPATTGRRRPPHRSTSYTCAGGRVTTFPAPPVRTFSTHSIPSTSTLSRAGSFFDAVAHQRYRRSTSGRSSDGPPSAFTQRSRRCRTGGSPMSEHRRPATTPPHTSASTSATRRHSGAGTLPRHAALGPKSETGGAVMLPDSRASSPRAFGRGVDAGDCSADPSRGGAAAAAANTALPRTLFQPPLSPLSSQLAPIRRHGDLRSCPPTAHSPSLHHASGEASIAPVRAAREGTMSQCHGHTSSPAAHSTYPVHACLRLTPFSGCTGISVPWHQGSESSGFGSASGGVRDADAAAGDCGAVAMGDTGSSGLASEDSDPFLHEGPRVASVQPPWAVVGCAEDLAEPRSSFVRAASLEGVPSYDPDTFQEHVFQTFRHVPEPPPRGPAFCTWTEPCAIAAPAGGMQAVEGSRCGFRRTQSMSDGPPGRHAYGTRQEHPSAQWRSGQDGSINAISMLCALRSTHSMHADRGPLDAVEPCMHHTCDSDASDESAVVGYAWGGNDTGRVPVASGPPLPPLRAVDAYSLRRQRPSEEDSAAGGRWKVIRSMSDNTLPRVCGREGRSAGAAEGEEASWLTSRKGINGITQAANCVGLCALRSVVSSTLQRGVLRSVPSAPAFMVALGV